MLAPLDNETIFKKAFTNKVVFQQFIKDLFNINIVVGKIETEKQFEPPIANINIKLDIYAETEDHKFVIEIQRIDYDYNFNRFLNYFITLLVEQQKKADRYRVKQTVLGIVVLTSPYKIKQLTGEPIKENVMIIDFNPRNLKDKRIEIWKHRLLFLNPHIKYQDPDTPKNYRDWLNLFRVSIDEKTSITLNLENKGIAKTVELIEYDKLSPETMAKMKIAEQRKAMIAIVENESKNEGIIIGMDKGIDKGRGQREYEIATKMIGLNIDIDTIQKSTELSKETIEKLTNELKNK